MEIKVLGSGCPKCHLLEASTRSAIERVGIEANIEKVHDKAEIMAYGVMCTPALLINGEIRIEGRIPTVDDVVGLLHRELLGRPVSN